MSTKAVNQDPSGMVCAKTSAGVGWYEEGRTGCYLRATRRTPDLGPPRHGVGIPRVGVIARVIKTEWAELCLIKLARLGEARSESSLF